MEIRTFLPGDEAAKVSLFNEAAADLPKFKPATLDEVRRRSMAKDLEKSGVFFAVEDGVPLGYAVASPNGRVSYPWCRKGHENLSEPLFQAALASLTNRGLKRAFAAYRGDWPIQKDFFLSHGFTLAREMVNYVIDLAEMPTPAAVRATSMADLQVSDIPALLELAPNALRFTDPETLGKYLFENPYFQASSLFTLRDRTTKALQGVGFLIENPSYADPRAVDSYMPCFRLGAFGTEGMSVKRINGLFSFLVRADRDATRWGLELMAHAAARLDKSDLSSMAAQVPSDVPHLARFYQQYFRKQGSFHVFEKPL